MLIKNILLLILFSFSILASAEPTTNKDLDCCDGGIIYGDKWAFIASAPKNWIMSSDPETLGVNVAFFENKSSPKESDPWMYITVNSKSAHHNSLNEFIAEDESKTRAEASNLKTSNVNLATNHPTLIRKFSFSDEYQHNELIAYEEFEDWFFTIVISANSEADLLAKQSAFIELLDSFKPLRKSD